MEHSKSDLKVEKFEIDIEKERKDKTFNTASCILVKLCELLNSCPSRIIHLYCKINWSKTRPDEVTQDLAQKLQFVLNGEAMFLKSAGEKSNDIGYSINTWGLLLEFQSLSLHDIALPSLPQRRSSAHRVTTKFSLWKSNLLNTEIAWDKFRIANLQSNSINVIRSSIECGTEFQFETDCSEFKGPLTLLNKEDLMKWITNNLPALLHSSSTTELIIGVKDTGGKVCGVVVDTEQLEDFITEPLKNHLQGYFPPIDLSYITLFILQVDTTNSANKNIDIMKFDKIEKAMKKVTELDGIATIWKGDNDQFYVGPYQEGVEEICRYVWKVKTEKGIADTYFFGRSAPLYAPHISKPTHLDTYMKLRDKWRPDVEEILWNGLYTHVLICEEETPAFLSQFSFDYTFKTSELQHYYSIFDEQPMLVCVIVLNSESDVKSVVNFKLRSIVQVIVAAKVGELALQFLRLSSDNMKVVEVVSTMYPPFHSLGKEVNQIPGLHPLNKIDYTYKAELWHDQAKKYYLEGLKSKEIRTLASTPFVLQRTQTKLIAMQIQRQMKQGITECKLYKPARSCGASTLLYQIGYELLKDSNLCVYIKCGSVALENLESSKVVILMDSDESDSDITFPSPSKRCCIVIVKIVDSQSEKGFRISPFLSTQEEAKNLIASLSSVFPDSKSSLQQLAEKFNDPSPYFKHIFMYVLTAVRNVVQPIEEWVFSECDKLNTDSLLLLRVMAFMQVFAGYRNWSRKHTEQEVKESKSLLFSKGGFLLPTNGDLVSIWHNLIANLVLQHAKWLIPSNQSILYLQEDQLNSLYRAYVCSTEYMKKYQSLPDLCNLFQRILVGPIKSVFSPLMMIVYHHLHISRTKDTSAGIERWFEPVTKRTCDQEFVDLSHQLQVVKCRMLCKLKGEE